MKLSCNIISLRPSFAFVLLLVSFSCGAESDSRSNSESDQPGEANNNSNSSDFDQPSLDDTIDTPIEPEPKAIEWSAKSFKERSENDGRFSQSLRAKILKGTLLGYDRSRLYAGADFRLLNPLPEGIVLLVRALSQTELEILLLGSAEKNNADDSFELKLDIEPAWSNAPKDAAVFELSVRFRDGHCVSVPKTVSFRDTDAEGGVEYGETHRRFDNFGRLVFEEYLSGASLNALILEYRSEHAYDTEGRLVEEKIEDFDRREVIERINTYPNNTTSFIGDVQAYNLEGQKTWGLDEEYSYSDDGRLLEGYRDYLVGGSVESRWTYRNTYDDRRRLVEARSTESTPTGNGSETKTYEYNESGLVTSYLLEDITNGSLEEYSREEYLYDEYYRLSERFHYEAKDQVSPQRTLWSYSSDGTNSTWIEKSDGRTYEVRVDGWGRTLAEIETLDGYRLSRQFTYTEDGIESLVEVDVSSDPYTQRIDSKVSLDEYGEVTQWASAFMTVDRQDGAENRFLTRYGEAELQVYCSE